MQENPNDMLSWKRYTKILVEAFLTFYLATFCIGMYFTHHGLAWFLTSILMVGLYIFVIIGSIKRMSSILSLAAWMLVIPIAPLAILIIVVTLIPILEILY